MENTSNLQEASVLLRDFYSLDNRICKLYAVINRDFSDEASALIRRETDRVEAIIKNMIEASALNDAEP